MELPAERVRDRRTHTCVKVAMARTVHSHLDNTESRRRPQCLAELGHSARDLVRNAETGAQRAQIRAVRSAKDSFE